MKQQLCYLVIRHMSYHRLRTLWLWLGLTLTCWLPLCVHHLTQVFEQRLIARAEQTPLILGVRGNAYDLVFHALYFRHGMEDRLKMKDWAEVAEHAGIAALPLVHGFHARSQPIVGITIDYLQRRQLRLSSGRAFTSLGECVLGAKFAREQGMEVGDSVMSDPENVFHLAGSYPLKLRVVGILAPSGSSDDSAVFVDLKTHWVLEGLGHGHATPETAEAASQEWTITGDGSLNATAAVLPYLEITAENAQDVHFHQSTEEMPISAVLIWPDSDRATALLLGAYQDPSQVLQLIRPMEVVESMMGWVFRVRTFLDLNYLLVGIAVISFLGLIMLLSNQLRGPEFAILRDLGASAGFLRGLVLVEWGLLILMALVCAVFMTLGMGALLRQWLVQVL